MVPEGFVDAATMADNNGCIEEWKYESNASIRKLWIPKTITKIGSHAFYRCLNLSEIQFEMDGTQPLHIGLMAFANCSSLRNLHLPARLASLGKGCFRDCSLLEDMEIDEGDSGLMVNDHLFDNCPGQVVLMDVVEGEVERRMILRTQKTSPQKKFQENALLKSLQSIMPINGMDRDAIARGLRTVYDMMKNKDDFPLDSYCRGYKAACEYYATISDWTNAQDCELRKLLVGRFIKKVASLNWGEIRALEFENANKNDLRNVCSSIAKLSGSDNEISTVLELEDRFCAQFTKRHPAAFYRTIVALHPEFTVPVPAIDRLTPVYAWLVGRDVANVLGLDWYRLSRVVRANLQGLLPEKDIYQLGVLSWFVAEAFRDDLSGRPDAMRRKGMVLKSLQDSGLL